VLELR